MQQITNRTGVTIALIKRPQDWQRLLHTHQYHLPVRHVTRIMQSPWVAFYMPSWHTTHPYCIRHVGHMTAMRITPRHTYLPDESTNLRADDLYAILTFDVMYTLRIPIFSAHWRRISIHHTTWGVLTRSYDLGALTHITRQLHSHTSADDAELFDLFEPDAYAGDTPSR
jgi:hypothetical protein